MPEVGAVAEDRGRPEERGRLVRQPREAQRDGAADDERAELEQHVRLVGARPDALACDRVEEREHEERVAARGRLDGGAELGVRLVLEPLPRERGDRRDRQRLRPDRRRRGVGQQLGQEPGIASLLGRPRRDRDEKRQPLEPAGEVAEPAERGAVGPVEVVDREHRRLLVRDVRREPVEAVQRRERRVDLVARPLDEARRLEQRRRERRRAREELLAPRGRRGRDQRLEELPHDAEREVALELAAPRGEDAHPAGGRSADGGEEPRLADPGGALDHHEVAVAAARGVRERVERGQLGVAFQQGEIAGELRRGHRAIVEVAPRRPGRAADARLISVPRYGSIVVA